MEGLDHYFLATVVFILLVYGLIKQIQHTLTIQKSNKRLIYNYKKILISNYVTSISFLGFAIFLMLNITNTLSQEYTALASYAFLAMLLIAKFGVTPKQTEQLVSRQ